MTLFNERGQWNTLLTRVWYAPYLIPGLAGGLSAAAIGLLHPRIGVLDADDVAYIVGAYSLQSGKGYADLTGGALYHWPPGFSLVLSLTAQPLIAVFVINLICLAAAIALAFGLARKVGWGIIPALGLTLALGFGMFRILALDAKPDILTYAAFFSGCLLYASSNRRMRFAGFALWSLLIPFKYIAAVFTPAGLVADAWTRSPSERFTWREWLGTLMLWAVMLGLLIGYNFVTEGEAFAPTHEASSITALPSAGLVLVTSIGRSLLTSWYGSVLLPAIFLTFLLVLLVGLCCLATLRFRPEGQIYRRLGLLILLFSALILTVRDFGATTRLMGYGLVIFAIGSLPLRRFEWLWLAYGAVMVLVGSANLVSTNSYGANDPRYEQVAEALALRLPSDVIPSNSYHLLDLHVRHPSIPVVDATGLGVNDYYLRITLPSYDAIASSVTPAPDPGAPWCAVVEVEGATLYHRCQP